MLVHCAVVLLVDLLRLLVVELLLLVALLLLPVVMLLVLPFLLLVVLARLLLLLPMLLANVQRTETTAQAVASAARRVRTWCERIEREKGDSEESPCFCR